MWRINPLLELHWRDWGFDSVVFEAASGGTYLFGPLPAAVLSCFEEGQEALSTIVRSIAEDLPSVPEADLERLVLESVEEFSRLGWLEPVQLP